MNTVLHAVIASPIGVAMRSFLRRSQAGRSILARVAANFHHTYEERFHEAIVSALRPGDVVWDVGANVGLYTKLFLDAVGSSGRVIALEPSPASAAECRALAMPDDRRLIIIEAAVSDTPGVAQLAVHGATATYNRIGDQTATAPMHDVRLVSGDIILAETGAAPTLVKIDVEGYELKVLRGMRSVLEGPQLRTLFIEVHFGLLESEGVRDAPRQIEALLVPYGFVLDWVDFSHVVARRMPS